MVKTTTRSETFSLGSMSGGGGISGTPYNSVSSERHRAIDLRRAVPRLQRHVPIVFNERPMRGDVADRRQRRPARIVADEFGMLERRVPALPDIAIHVPHGAPAHAAVRVMPGPALS